MLHSPAATRAFDISREDPRVRDRYGRNKHGQSLLLARRLVEAGVRFISVYDGSRNGVDNWDTHANNFVQLKDTLLPPADQALAALLEDLDARGLLDSTLVIWMGEFGRTPRINANAGRDHWPNCFSVVLAGGGVRGGSTYGASDKCGGYPDTAGVTPGDLAATLFWRFGLNPAQEIHDANGRPYRLAEGNPIRELFPGQGLTGPGEAPSVWVPGRLSGEGLLAAVNPNELAAQESAGGRAQEADDAGDFVRAAVTDQCVPGDHPPRIEVGDSGEPLRDRPPRRDAVDGDVVGTELLGQAAGVLMDRGLCDRIGRADAPAAAAADAADGNDPAGAPTDHLGSDFATTEDHTHEVPLEDTPQVGHGDIQAIVVLGTAGAADPRPPCSDVSARAADEQADRPPPLPDLGGDAPDLALVGQVAPDRQGLDGAGGRDVGGDLLHRFSLAKSPGAVRAGSMDGDPGAEPSELPGHGASQAA